MDTEETFGEVFNVGTAEETTIADLARRIIVSTASESGISLVPYDEAYEEGFEDMVRRIPDIAKVEKYIGWRPSHSLDEIIAHVAESRQVAPVT